MAASKSSISSLRDAFTAIAGTGPSGSRGPGGSKYLTSTGFCAMSPPAFAISGTPCLPRLLRAARHQRDRLDSHPVGPPYERERGMLFLRIPAGAETRARIAYVVRDCRRRSDSPPGRPHGRDRV